MTSQVPAERAVTGEAHELAPQRLRERDLLSSRKGVVARRDQHQPVGPEREGLQPREVGVTGRDADLGVLGGDPSAYAAYASAVRAEFAVVDDETFRVGRSRVLADLLERPSLFSTAAGRNRWEQRARDNLAAELALLRSSAGVAPGDAADRPPATA